MGRYDVDGPEAEFEPGSRGRVLRNLSVLGQPQPIRATRHTPAQDA
jgi:hypothetical protein